MMKMNRKALALLVSAMLAAATAGCGNPAENDGSALEAVASLPDSVTEMGAEPDAGEPAATAEPTTEPAAEPTAEPTAAPTTAPTAEPTTEPTAEPTATAEPEKTSEPAKTQPAQAGNNAAPVIASNAPATSGVVTSTETVTTQVEHQRPEGMPAVCYSEEETLMAMLFYGQPGDGYVDNGDGTWSYCWCGPDGSTTDTVTSTVTTDNWYSGTEADVLAKLEELRGMYPEGTVWNTDTVYDNPGSTLDAYITNNNACAGFAKLVSDYCFGYDAPSRYCQKTLSQLKAGDIIQTPDHVQVYAGWYEIHPDEGLTVIRCYGGNAVSGYGTLDGVVYYSDTHALCTDGDTALDVITRWPE